MRSPYGHARGSGFLRSCRAMRVTRECWDAEPRRVSQEATVLPTICLGPVSLHLASYSTRMAASSASLRYRGPDLDSATEAEFVSVTSRVNNVSKRFGVGWASSSRPSACPSAYPVAASPIPVSWWWTRNAGRLSARRGAYESRYYVTFPYLPPADRDPVLSGIFYERAEPKPSGTRSPAPSRGLPDRDRSGARVAGGCLAGGWLLR